MTIFKHPLFHISLLMIAAVLGWIFGRSPQGSHLEPGALSHLIDHTMTNVRFYEFDETGRLTKHGQLQKMVHIPFNNQFILTYPHFSLHGPDHQRWHLSAHHAYTKHGTEKIIFQEQVTLNQPHPQHTTTMYTETLTYLPKTSLAFTHASVWFKQPQQLLASKGMRADLSLNQVKLYHAHATIHPNQDAS